MSGDLTLDAARDPFRALVEEIPAITYIADFDGAFTLRYVSPQLQAILGLRPEAWLEDPEGWTNALHPDDRDRILAEAEACIEAEQPFDFEYRMIASDGRVVHLWEKTSIVRDADGRPIAVNGVMLDVTALKEAQEAVLREAQARAAERSEFETTLRRQAAENRHQALHDELTRLPNRRQLYRRLEHGMATAGPDDGLSLLLVDLDRFKEVNDVLGHQCGDELLRQVAARFASITRNGDLLARLGGDEFAILVRGRRGPDTGLEVAQRLSAVLADEFLLDDVPVHVEASIGIARFPEDGDDTATLMRCADAAMYSAKELNTELELFDVTRDRHNPTRLQLLGQLRRAIARGELVLHYQPKVGLDRDEVVGVEALVRWQHPEEGLLPPDEFIPLAEQTGLIKPLTTHVLRTALAQVRAWREEGHDLAVAVNVSERTILDRDFPDEVRELLAEHEVPGHRLELEITEGTIMADPVRAVDTLRRLRELGVRLSLDDFGTGYSSLSRLRDLPIDELKIDRCFVTGMDTDDRDVAIIRSTIELGHNLGCVVVAEGLESGVAMARLSSLGCDSVQGFHIARPLSPEALIAWLRER
jgi:diguanylate cyclase (GGDEF)-like protein/PAS domain S-box-containing protein